MTALSVVALTLAHEFRSVGEGRYILEVPKFAIVLDVDRLRRERGALHGELTVSCGMPGTRSVSGTLYSGNFNVSVIKDRRDAAGMLATQSNAPDVDWLGLVEELCQRVIAAERDGKPAIMLRDLARPDPGEDLEVDGIRLLRRHPVVLFGDGGDAKSYLALYLASRLAERGLRVLYADWEFAGEDHRDRLERLCGPDMPELLYVRCERPMVAESDRLRRIVREERLDYLVADSVAFAADGPPEAAEVAAGYFRGLRQIGVGSLNVAHTTKAEGGDQKPFGSTFWHNGARSTWFVKRAAGEPGDAHLGVALFNRKANLGPLRPAVGYSITFGEDRTTFERTDVAGMGSDLASRLSVRARMTAVLRQGSMTMAAIAGDLDVPIDTIVKTVKRGEGKAFVRVPGPDGIYRIGLAARTG